VITIDTVEKLLASSCADMGVGAWYDVTQARVNAFAECTGDLQHIHVDPQRALEAGLPGTIAHGFYTVSLLPLLARTRAGMRLQVPSRMAINYGLNKVRFVTAVRIPSRIRLHTVLGDVTRVSDSVIQVVYRHTVEIEGEPRPAMYAEAIDRLFV
jgi:acyl dehydratase